MGNYATKFYELRIISPHASVGEETQNFVIELTRPCAETIRRTEFKVHPRCWYERRLEDLFRYANINGNQPDSEAQDILNIWTSIRDTSFLNVGPENNSVRDFANSKLKLIETQASSQGTVIKSDKDTKGA